MGGGTPQDEQVGKHIDDINIRDMTQIVARRLSTIRNADRIIFMGDNGIVGRGRMTSGSPAAVPMRGCITHSSGFMPDLSARADKRGTEAWRPCSPSERQ